MTCGIAVKRPLDYETYLSPETGVDIKRSRHEANLKCSPFRPQLGTLATSLIQSANSTPFQQKNESQISSPFASLAGKCQLSSSQLESYLIAEVQYLKRRKLIPRRNGNATVDTGGQPAGGMAAMNSSGQDPNKTPTSAYRRAASSPSPSNSGSDSDGETNGRGNMLVEQAPSTQDPRMTTASLYEKPQFSLHQVKLICERLLKEQEIRLRYEYETVLIKKLDEQHDQYVQFAKEQLETRASTSSDMSYLS